MRGSSFCVAALLLGCAAASVKGDTWEAPKNRKVPSENGKYTALVVPRSIEKPGGADAEKPVVHLYKGVPGAGGKWSTLWKVKLSNETAPVDVFVTNDGRHVVTLDNWHSVGYGEDVVAFYAAPKEVADAKVPGPPPEGRQLARYSLEKLLSRDEIEKVSHSVSSRWWRNGGSTFLDEAGETPYLCVRLGNGGRWLAWDVTTGKPVDVAAADPKLVRRWDQRAAAMKDRAK
jgi:hypothetical protein